MDIHTEFYNDLMFLDPLSATYNGYHKYDHLYHGPKKYKELLKKIIEKYRTLLANVHKDLNLLVLEDHLNKMELELKYNLELLPISHLENPFKDILEIIDRTLLNKPNGLHTFKKRILMFISIIPEIEENLLIGAKKGYLTNDNVMNILIKDLKNLKLETKIESFKIYNPKDYIQFMNVTFIPSAKKFAKFLENLPVQKEIGIYTFPNKKLYHLFSRDQLDIDIDPDYLHNLGIKMTNNLFKLKQKLKSEIKNSKNNKFSSSDEVVSTYKAKVKEYTNLIDYYFESSVKKIVGVPSVVSISEEFEPAASYWQADPVKKNKGRFKINTYNWHLMMKSDVPYLTMHEANFGHHLHLEYNLRNKNIPKWLTLSHSTSVAEGWGLYTEYLLLRDSLNVFNLTNLEKVSSLNAMLLRSLRLVIDTGIHTKGWSFNKCFKFMKKYLDDPDSEIKSEIYRYSVCPGQALCYVVGYLAIDNLSKKYSDIKEFHSKFLKNSYLPLNFLINEI